MIDVERVDFVSLPVDDLAEARNFYGRTLGLPESTPPDFAFPEFESSNVTLNLFDPTQVGGSAEPPKSSLALRVPDVAEARARLEEAGVEFLGETIDSGVCYMAFFRDPFGNTLLLHRRYSPSHAEAGS